MVVVVVVEGPGCGHVYWRAWAPSVSRVAASNSADSGIGDAHVFGIPRVVARGRVRGRAVVRAQAQLRVALLSRALVPAAVLVLVLVLIALPHLLRPRTPSPPPPPRVHRHRECVREARISRTHPAGLGTAP